MKKRSSAVWISATLIAMTSGTLLSLPANLNAQSKAVPLEGVRYNTATSIRDNLKIFAGKRVQIHLRSGKSLAGVVKKVSDHLIHLEKLDGREFFDALIRIEDISAFDTRFRKM